MRHALRPHTQALLLLCAPLGHAAGPRLLNVRELHRLLEYLRKVELPVADLVRPEVHCIEQAAEAADLGAERLLALLKRGAPLALAVESWSSRGIWVLSLLDGEYPLQLSHLLGPSMPPVLYGLGDLALLSGGGLAIVGSREADEEALGFTRRLAALCAQNAIPVISGGARGVDSAATASVLDNGGQSIGVVASDLATATLSGRNRDALIKGALTLVSPYDPDAHFTVGNAMGRNKIIYALSTWAVVVHCSLERGGTWAGALEDLRRCTVPLLVRSGSMAPEGNRRLIELGGIPLPPSLLHEIGDLRAWLDERARRSSPPSHQEGAAPRQLSLLHEPECDET